MDHNNNVNMKIIKKLFSSGSSKRMEEFFLILIALGYNGNYHWIIIKKDELYKK